MFLIKVDLDQGFPNFFANGPLQQDYDKKHRKPFCFAFHLQLKNI